MKKAVIMIISVVFLILLAGCTKKEKEVPEVTVSPETVITNAEVLFSNTTPVPTEAEAAPTPDTTPVPVRITVDSLLYKEFDDLRDTYEYEPKYDAGQWMNEAGELLFPYEADIESTTFFIDDLALLYMPEEVLVKAATKDLLQVVMEGWLESNVTSIAFYSTPSHYLLSCTIKNQASNELLRRSDMVSLLYEDYCNRDYAVGESEASRKTADKIQFAEIILASNYAFSLMDDAMKEQVLKEAMEKQEQVMSGNYWTEAHSSGFFAFVAEEERNGGSSWYQYICDNKLEEAENAVCFAEMCWLLQSYY